MNIKHFAQNAANRFTGADPVDAAHAITRDEVDVAVLNAINGQAYRFAGKFDPPNSIDLYINEAEYGYFYAHAEVVARELAEIVAHYYEELPTVSTVSENDIRITFYQDMQLKGPDANKGLPGQKMVFARYENTCENYPTYEPNPDIDLEDTAQFSPVESDPYDISFL